MQYQVLARKWRPQNFHDIVGQEHVTRTLFNALQGGRLAHAFLFSGPRGSGKTTTARILAKAANCHAGKPAEPCNRCVACIEITNCNCMDVLEIDAASNRGIDEIRELKEKVRYHPARDKHRIFIIDEAHMLTAEAFNALLKTLEEPPPHVIFIMATTEYHKIPATILSRCQQYGFRLIRFPLILDRLRQIAAAESIRISQSALEQITYSSGGSMRDAMSALDQVIAFSGDSVRDEDVTMLLGLVEPAVLGAMVRALAENDSDKILRIVAEVAETGQDFQNFCRRLLGQFRNLMVLKAGSVEPSVLGVPESLTPELRSQAGLFSQEDLLRLFDALLKLEIDLKHSTQMRFQLEMGLVELAHISRMRPLEDVVADFSRLVKGDVSGSLEAGEQDRKQKAASIGPRGGEPDAPKSDRRRADPHGETSELHSSRESFAAMDPAERPSAEQDRGERCSRELLLKIGAAVRKESLESFLSALRGARLEGDSVILDPGAVNEFHRRQVKENLTLITQAACSVLGRTVNVQLDEAPREANDPGPGPRIADSQATLLDRAKREPVVQSFLEIFPGPVKAEKLDP